MTTGNSMKLIDPGDIRLFNKPVLIARYFELNSPTIRQILLGMRNSDYNYHLVNRSHLEMKCLVLL